MNHVPARPEVARAHFRVRFEAATGQHHGFGVEGRNTLGRERLDTGDLAFGILHQFERSGFIMKFHAGFFEDCEVALLQTSTATVHGDDIVIADRRWRPVVALRRQPMHRLQRLGDMHLQHVLVRLIVGDVHDLVPQLGLGAVRQAFQQRPHFIIGIVTDQRFEIFGTVERKAHQHRQHTVTATVALRRFFEHTHSRGFFERSQCGRARGVTGTNNQYIVIINRIRHGAPPSDYFFAYFMRNRGRRPSVYLC